MTACVQYFCQSHDLPISRLALPIKESKKLHSRTRFQENNFINNYFSGETPADRKIEIFHFGYGSSPLETSNAR